MQIIDCKASFQAIIPALPPGYQLVGTEWTFGDGHSSSLPNPVHYYAAPGVYQVCLTTTIFNGSQCCTKTYCQNINIDKACDGGCDFDAQITWNVNPDECEFEFDLIVNFAGMPITNIFWDFGDGTYGTGVPIKHTFEMASLSVFSDLIRTILSDEKFKSTVSGDVLEPISNSAEREMIVKAALRCIFGSPQGVRKMAETKDHLHIKNKRNWQPFCGRLLDYIKENFKKEILEMEKVSGLFSSYKKFWPDCDQELSKDVEKAVAAQNKK